MLGNGKRGQAQPLLIELASNRGVFGGDEGDDFIFAKRHLDLPIESAEHKQNGKQTQADSRRV